MIRGIRFYVILIVLPSAALALAPRLEWAFETEGKIYASPILADVDGDGRTEIIVCASRDKRVLCLSGMGELLWSYRVDGANNDGIQATASAVDADGDGRLEIYFADMNGIVGCLDYQGRLLWRTYLGSGVNYSGPVLADMDGDGAIEVLVGAEDGSLYCLDDCGMERWHYQGDGAVRGIPAVAYNALSHTAHVYAVFSRGRAACLEAGPQMLWSQNEPGARGERRSGPAVGDLDHDGQAEVIWATEDFQVVVSNAATGQERWRWKGKGSLDQTGTFALADFDGSGKLDILCGDSSGYVYRLRDGQSLWAANVGGGVVQGPSIGDVDGDGKLDVLVCSRGNRLTCLTADGQEAWTYPSEAGSLTTPAIGDVDGDGQTEIVFTSKDRFVYCVTVDGAYHPERVPWPCISHDAQLTGNYTGVPFLPRGVEIPEKRLADLEFKSFGPLQMGTNRVEFSFTNNSQRPRRLEVHAKLLPPAALPPVGLPIAQVTTGRFEPYENARAYLDFPALFEGEYELRLRLFDIGTGETLAEKVGLNHLHSYGFEEEELDDLLTEGQRLVNKLSDNEAVERGQTALRAAADHARKEITDARQDKNASMRAREAAVKRVHEALRETRREGARLRAAERTPGTKLDFAVVSDTQLKKVFKDEPYLRKDAEAWPSSVSLAANELEGVQIVVVPLWKDLKNLRITVTDLNQIGGSSRIPSEDILVYRIGYVKIGPSEYNFRVEKQGWWPDITFSDSPIDVAADQDAQPYFVTVRTRDDTPAGDYAGEIHIVADGCSPVNLPFQAHVWDFALPKETHLKTSFWMNESWLQRFYKYSDRTPLEVRKRFYQYHLDHRAGPIKDFPLNGEGMMEDFEYLMANGQNNFFIGVPGLATEKERTEFLENVRTTRALLEQKGWDQMALFYSWDEVAVMTRHAIPQFVETNAWLKTTMSWWPRLETSAPEPSLFGAVDIWCPVIDHFDPQVLEDRKAKGERLWFYTVWGRPGIMIEFPATDHRLMFWECWKYGAEGFLYWGTTHWNLNCTSDKRWPEVDWIPWNEQPGHNGCGYLIYPGPDGTPLGSTRFEAVRDGIEDYEYLHLLKTLLESMGDSIPPDLRARTQAELAIDPQVLVDNKIFTEDPKTILAARERIAALIETLEKKQGGGE
ncbi:MAG: VCBS repeat-containing protein [Candidatus Hydrogenedentes bacterium]|nr:VCBS repeat-containing protein [Candidatus Hydrogenedentota bacterium]